MVYIVLTDTALFAYPAASVEANELLFVAHCSFSCAKSPFCLALQSKFPLMGKVEVNGPQTHPIYAFLKEHTPPLPGVLLVC